MIGLLVNGKPRASFKKLLPAWNSARNCSNRTGSVVFVFMRNEGCYVVSEPFIYKPHRFVEFTDWYREMERKYAQ